jgi:hypothetical protein
MSRDDVLFSNLSENTAKINMKVLCLNPHQRSQKIQFKNWALTGPAEFYLVSLEKKVLLVSY